jgi:hypothetical protein
MSTLVKSWLKTLSIFFTWWLQVYAVHCFFHSWLWLLTDVPFLGLACCRLAQLYCWPLPAQSFSGPSPLGLATVFYCLRFETSLFVDSYDSQGHGGGIRPRLHTGGQLTHILDSQIVKVKVTLRLTVSQSVSLGVEPHLGLMARYFLRFDSYGFVSVGRPLW